MKFTYLLVDFLTVIVPFVFSFHPKLRFNKKFNSFFKANIIVLLVFILWDILFTARGVWSFNSEYTLGINIFNLPIEEVLFFICIPFACVFTYHCSVIFKSIDWNEMVLKILILFLSGFLFLIGIFSLDKEYTSVTFISTAVLLMILKFHFNVGWLPRFISVYPFLLIPFFIVNGILTGTGLSFPVVSYNNSETLGIRLLTIPVEDTVYAFELLLLNIFFYERFNREPHSRVARSASE